MIPDVHAFGRNATPIGLTDSPGLIGMFIHSGRGQPVDKPLDSHRKYLLEEKLRLREQNMIRENFSLKYSVLCRDPEWCK